MKKFDFKMIREKQSKIGQKENGDRRNMMMIWFRVICIIFDILGYF